MQAVASNWTIIVTPLKKSQDEDIMLLLTTIAET